MPIGGTGTITIIGVVDSPLPDGTILVANATLHDDEGNSVSADDTTIVDGSSNLALAVGVSPDPVAANGQFTYTVVYGNPSTNTMTNVVISQDYDPLVSWVSSSVFPSTPTFDAWNVGTLLPGQGGFLTVTTHVDALCHVWDGDGMWGGRDYKQELTTEGTRWGGIEHWRDGITTRGVLLDVPKHRGKPFVTIEEPVHGHELEAIATAQGVSIEPGDALVVYSGREAFQAEHREWSGYVPPSREEIDRQLER